MYIQKKVPSKTYFQTLSIFSTRLSINVGEHGVHEIIINSKTAKRLRLKALTDTLTLKQTKLISYTRKI